MPLKTCFNFFTVGLKEERMAMTTRLMVKVEHWHMLSSQACALRATCSVAIKKIMGFN
jgi:hypothetical protein